MRSHFVVVLGASAACWAPGCSLGLSGLEPSSADASASDAPLASDTSRASTDDGDGPFSDEPSGGEEADVVGSNGCPVTTAGPAMAPVGDGGFCIDTTEVTNAQYVAFLAAGSSLVTLPAACSATAGYTPSNGWPYATGDDNLPVVWVDWCDAYAYCQWAGKRLCGRIGGGSNPPSAWIDATGSQWFSACSTGGAQAYPYGNTYEQNVCYGAQPTTAPLVAVKSNPGCVGGYPGIFDMSGSVEEWEDSCDAEMGAGDECQVRGGNFGSDPMSLACAENNTGHRGLGEDDRGFRCCAP